MKTKSKERRVINIPKDDYDIIKEYCKKNAYNVSAFITKMARIDIDRYNENETKKQYTIDHTEWFIDKNNRLIKLRDPIMTFEFVDSLYKLIHKKG